MIVVVRNGCKSYSDGIPVLDGLNLNVKSGTIYGLLGSSGCGKTTLLSCMVGLKKLDSGEIYVNGSSPGIKGSNIPGVGVGFMPQSMSSLSISLTIKQTFWFYGRIYGMPDKRILERIQILSEFLQLHDTSKVIQNLSGGQLRRVSLGVAMIHQPPLLILDEPTVGLDPLLRQNIWEHLFNLVETDKTTILLTTHYSEEAKSCETIGIMRRGHLIAEDSPDMLLSQSDSPLLETAILQLCRRDEDAPNNTFQDVNTLPQSYQARVCNCLEEKETKFIFKKNIIIIVALLYRSLITYKTQPLIIVAQLLIPLLNIVLANYIVGTEPNGMTLNFVNQDWNALQNQTEIHEYCADYKDMNNRTCFAGGISILCAFINQYEEHEINWNPKSSKEKALSSVRNGDSIGYLKFPTNFSQHLMERMLFRAYSENETIDGSIINIRMDMSNSILKLWLFERVFKNYAKFISGLAKDCDKNARTVQIPLKYNAIYGEANGGSWSTFIQPYFFILILYMLSCNISGGLLILGKRRGITEMWTVAGVKFGHILICNIFFESFVIFFQIGILFTILLYFYGMEVQGSWLLVMLTVYLVSVGGVAFGILLSTILNHEIEFIMVNLCLVSISITSAGGMWPIEAINPWYRTLCQMIPVALPLEAMRSIMFRGWGLEYFQVWRGIAISLLYIVLSVLLGNRFHNRK